jgi:hypothetical protein
MPMVPVSSAQSWSRLGGHALLAPETTAEPGNTES